MADYKLQLPAFVKDVEKLLEKLTHKTFMLQLGKKMREIIYKRTKSGKGVTSITDEEPGSVSLKPLSKKYVARRKKLKLGPGTSPGKSNLTLTGQMLDSILVEAIRQGFSVYVPDTTRKDGGTNEDVAIFVQADRPFLNLTQDEQKILVREMQKELDRLAKKLFK